MFNIIVKHGSIMFYTYYTLRNIKNKNSDGKIIVPSKLVKTNIYAHSPSFHSVFTRWFRCL